MISFILPAYNVENYIADCIDSIISQIDKIPGSEIIVVNDGSKNKTADVLKQYSHLPFIKIINKENEGVSRARNLGLDMAGCEYVWFLDSDDLLSEAGVDGLKKAMSLYPDNDLYYSGLIKCNENGKEIISSDPLSIDSIERISRQEFFDRYYLINFNQRFIIKREHLLRNKIRYIEGFCFEDNPFGLMLVYLTDHIVLLKEPVFIYRQRLSGNITSDMGKIRHCRDRIAWHKVLMDFYNTMTDKSQPDYFFDISWRAAIKDSVIYSKHLFHTKEYRDFYRQNAKYIKEQTKAALPYIRHGKRFAQVFQYSPILAAYISSLLHKLGLR